MVCKGFDRDAAWLDRAEVEARRAAELAPSLPEAHRALGHLWNHRRRPDLALREFHRAVELDPRFVLALMQLANTYVFLGNVSRSEIYLRRARDLDPRDPRTAVLIPSLLVRQGRYDEVHEAASIARALDPPALHRLWLRETELRALAAQGRLEDVRRLSETIRAESDTARPFPRVLLGFAAAVRGDRDEAAAWLDPAGLVECKLAGVLVLAAKAWAALGEDEAAIGMIERANALDLLDADELRRDSYLAPLAGNPRYRAIVESMPWMGEDPAGAAPASAPPAARGG
jgi:Flp pilus assembly protein TadD